MENVKPKQPLRKWESMLNQSFWVSLLLSVYLYGILVRKAILNLVRVAFKGVRTTLVLSNKTLQVNSRLYLSLVFMLVLAPLSNVSYQLFDPSVRIEGWYHSNFFYYLYIMSPWIALLFFSTGLFLLFPSGAKRAYFTVVPMISAIVKILWLHQVTNNTEFHQVIPLYFIVPAALIAFIWVFCINWLMDRKFHQHDALKARMDTILNAPDSISDADKLAMLKTTWEELKNFQSNY